MFAAAPRAKNRPRRAAAVGTETGRPVELPEKRSMIRPIPNGMDRDTVDDTQSYIRARVSVRYCENYRNKARIIVRNLRVRLLFQ